jgi:ATP-dependent DNA helicase RecG
VSQIPGRDVLRRVLLLEQEHDYDNRAVIGGLSALARTLHSEAPAGSSVPEAALLLAHYDDEDVGNRRTAIDAALLVLDATPASTDSRPAKSTRSVKTDRGSEFSGPLALPLTVLKGVGDARAMELQAIGLATIGDALYYLPREHLDYRRRDRIAGLKLGERTTLLATVELARTRHIGKNMTITTVIVSDETGRVSVEWFNQPYLEKTFRPGRRVAISGELDLIGDRRVFKPRDYEWVEDRELTHAARLVPIYPLKKGLGQKSLRSLMRQVVDACSARVCDPLPNYIREHFELTDLAYSLARYHFPDEQIDADEARRRLAFDEVLSIQLGLRLRRRESDSAGDAPAITLTESERTEFITAIPFTPTPAQTRVMAQLEGNLASTRPMARLLQGDVGSGKTVVAALALYAASRRNFQGVMMAPTEILAQQHFASLSRLLEPLGVTIALLTGSTSGKVRASVLDDALTGRVDVLVGTHALFQDDVALANVGVAIIDEQHRFGVEQRTRLRRKGVSPHLLAMTATPIPRTLQLTLYGDLDISVIDELPHGRIPIKTRLVSGPHQAYTLVENEVAAGRQAFVVCPVIDESLDDDMKSAIAEHQRLRVDVFPGLRIGLLHGKMKPSEKDAVLAAFRHGNYDVLVATSVVEVGIDVPNATIMVIRDAHRFGLAQLHQLRGRIGRGAEQSYCVLVSRADEGPTLERLEAVVASQDGFKLAEKDLELRGPGEFWGTRQSGMPELKVAGPGDGPVIEMAGKAADMILNRDPDLISLEHARIRTMVDRFWQQVAELH